MAISVRYLPEKVIEKEAEFLLEEYTETTGEVVELPVPVDEITTYHLALNMAFADLHEVLAIPKEQEQPDVLGAIWVDKEAILIDHSLDPKQYPSMIGRYRFSVAHEVGHWQLHKSYVAKDVRQGSLFGGQTAPTVICRTSQRKKPIEWQADYFASCLLMPRALVLGAWDEMFPDRRQRVLKPALPIEHSFVEIPRMPDFTGDPDSLESENEALERFCRPLAKRFHVSPITMRIRLEKLGLLHRVPPLQRHLATP